MTDDPAPEAPFTRLKIRSSALVFCGDDVALIRRDRAVSVHYTTIGGNVEGPEPLRDALRRELAEELRLDVGQAESGELLWVVDQRVSRPGPTPPPRKLHLLYRYHDSTNSPTAPTRSASSSGSTTARPPTCRSSRPSAPPWPPCPPPAPKSPTPSSRPSPTRTTAGSELSGPAVLTAMVAQHPS
ncbi:NUDIX domain-containing protein [Streptomyces sp. NPDC060027]|uniref:NUDIX domain-containing protein n=1 Tax=Streptomyces sp. NPDC060027 TaxID=3347040 RepID=UPI0036913B34